MFKTKKINWHNPLEMAQAISNDPSYKENWALLYSGLYKDNSHSYSYLALYPKKEIIADDFTKFASELNQEQNLWFGYFGYDLKNSLENLTTTRQSFINLPNLWMVNYQLILQFNHHDQKIICYYQDQKWLKKIPQPLKIRVKKIPEISVIKSNFDTKEYFQKLDIIQKKIIQGDLYQANLTRKFFGTFRKKPENVFEFFLRLNKFSPANYSSFLKLGKNYIISSSPELFLAIDKNNQVISSPIKGTVPRFANHKLDILSKKILKNSSKEKAENLMIVDLVRNDLSKNCLINSIKVKNLFKISSYKNIHHMSSDICGIKSDKYSTLDLVKSCFPPASMTGTPKIKAMEICNNLEQESRGVYSGAIGFFKGNQDCKLSVIIRTVIICEKDFEFQVGGAITFDSDPKKELQETINKARGICKALAIKVSDLKNL